MKRKVLILGGADFIGARLAGFIANSDSLAPVLVDDRASLPTSQGFECVAANLHDQEALRVLISGAATVVNCVSGSAQHMLGCARALFRAARQIDSPTILQLSTMAAYGSSEGLINETASLTGDVDAYSAARAEIDQMAADHGCICLRPGIIYGPGSMRWSGLVGHLLLQRRLGDLGAAGDGTCNLLYIDDLLRAVHTLLNEPERASGSLNLCGRERPTWNDYFIQYAKALKAVPVRRITNRRMRIETKIFAPPLKVARIILGERAATRLHLPELLPPSLLRVCTQDITLDTSKAESVLAPSWTPLVNGLQHAAEWYVSKFR